MQEISIKNNPLGLKVFVDELPDISLIPKSDLDLLITDLELEIASLVEKKRKRVLKKSQPKKLKVPP